MVRALRATFCSSLPFLRIPPAASIGISMAGPRYLEDFTSDDGLHTVTVERIIQDFKRKDDYESVGVFEGLYKGKEVIIKVFQLLYVPWCRHMKA